MDLIAYINRACGLFAISFASITALFAWMWDLRVATLFAIVTACFLGFWFLLNRAVQRALVDHRTLPARPEFYDFKNRDQPMHWDEIQGKSLADLTYVVFDTETTGLRPSDGDEIVSIAAVKIVAEKVDESSAFSRLVNPGRAIPAASIKFHGITDDMVQDEPDIGPVLQGFHDFIGDAVLIAHNAAFDMRFLQLKEESTGIVISNLVLDTLLISVFLDHESENHSLDGIAQRMGISLEGRHTALGDAVTTARVFQKMLPRLERRGVTALRQIVDASAKVESVRRLRDKF